MSASQLAQEQCCEETRSANCCSEQFQTVCVCGAVGLTSADEVLSAQAANCNCLTADASGGFANLDHSINDVTVLDADPSKLVAANIARVVSAGCGCCPADNFGAVGQQDAERVLGVEGVNFVPANGCGGERIGDAKPLVADHELGSQEAQPSNRNQENGPGPYGRILPLADHHGESNKNNNCCQSDAAPRPNNLRVSHASIIAGDVK